MAKDPNTAARPANVDSDGNVDDASPSPGLNGEAIGTYDEPLPTFDAPKIKKGVFGRTAKALGSLRKVASARRKPESREAQLEAAERLVAAAGALKGGYAKLGQLLSYVDQTIPEDARVVLARLQAAIPPMPFDEMAAVFQEDAGHDVREVFPDITERPVAAASIGQVHRATAPDGKTVAVKVQYPGIERAMASDSAALGLMVRLVGALIPGMDAKGMVRELKTRLAEECDYINEAKNQTLFGQLHAPEPGWIVPRVYPELSSRRVLVTEWVEGRSFARFVADSDQDQRDEVGLELFRFAMSSLMRWGAFNGDPHPGNYRLLNMGQQICFLDFGCCKYVDPDTLSLLKRNQRAMLDDDIKEWIATSLELGVLRKGAPDYEGGYRRARTMAEPLVSEEAVLFDQEALKKGFQDGKSPRQIMKTEGFSLPPDFLVLERVQFGLFQILATLEVTKPLRPLYSQCVDAPVEPLPAVDGDDAR